MDRQLQDIKRPRSPSTSVVQAYLNSIPRRRSPVHPFNFNSSHQILSKMKLFLQGTAILALLISNASAAQSGVFAANGVELELYQSGEDVIYGEPVST